MAQQNLAGGDIMNDYQISQLIEEVDEDGGDKESWEDEEEMKVPNSPPRKPCSTYIKTTFDYADYKVAGFTIQNKMDFSNSDLSSDSHSENEGNSSKEVGAFTTPSASCQQLVYEDPSKNVSFNPLVQVCFVASRLEYGPALRDLFWHQADYDFFKQDAINEIRMYWKLSGTSAKEAITALYQPEYENYFTCDIQGVVSDRIIPDGNNSGSRANEASAPELIYDEEGRGEEDEEQIAANQGEIADDAAGIDCTVMRHVDSLACLAGADLNSCDTDSESGSGSTNASNEGNMAECHLAAKNTNDPVDAKKKIQLGPHHIQSGNTSTASDIWQQQGDLPDWRIGAENENELEADSFISDAVNIDII